MNKNENQNDNDNDNDNDNENEMAGHGLVTGVSHDKQYPTRAVEGHLYAISHPVALELVHLSHGLPYHTYCTVL
jgi:hypothetical protein